MNETDNPTQFAAASLEHTYYYGMERGHIAPMDVAGVLQDISLTYDRPLLFSPKRPDAFIHMVTARTQDGEEVKARVCFDEESAQQIYANVQHATSLGVRTPQALRRYGRLVVLDFAEGESITDPTLGEVVQTGALYAQLNEPMQEITGRTSEKLGSLVDTAFSLASPVLSPALGTKLQQEIDTHTPSHIVPVFDHQDIGLHNVLAGNDDSIVLIDEEAFGVLPFGITLDKALHDTGKTAICRTEADRRLYLAEFPDDMQEYYLETQRYWRLVSTLRLAARFVALGKDGYNEKAAGLLEAIA